MSIKLLLCLKPSMDAGHAGQGSIWANLIASIDARWGYGITGRFTLPDGSVMLSMDRVLLPVAMAAHAIDFLGQKTAQRVAGGVPLRILVDLHGGTDARPFRPERIHIDWERIQPGEIHTSVPAYGAMRQKLAVSLGQQAGGDGDRPFYKLVLPDEREFLFREALKWGDGPPCFYCGAREHLPVECPSKKLSIQDRSLERIGYASLRTVNRSFLDYLTLPSGEIEAMEEKLQDSPALLAHHAFFDLRRVFQLRFFRVMFSNAGNDWERVTRAASNGGDGGLLWLAQDCLSVSNLDKARIFLDDSLASHGEDWKLHCIQGFLRIEEGSLVSADCCFEKAASYAQTVPQKIYLLLLLSRCIHLEDDYHGARQRLREVYDLYPGCSDALYQDIVLQFKEKKEVEALQRLLRLVQYERHYYGMAWVDPDFAPYADLIQPELTRLFTEAQKAAVQVAGKAREVIKQTEELLGKGAAGLEEAKTSLLKIDPIQNKESYLDCLDRIHHARAAIAACERAVEGRKKATRESIGGLRDRVKKSLSYLGKFPYQDELQPAHQTLALFATRLNEAERLLWDEAPASAGLAAARVETLSGDMNRTETNLRKLKAKQDIHLFLVRFMRKAFLFMSISFLLTVVGYPLAAIYVLKSLPEGFHISSIPELISSQKILILFGALFSLIFALFTSLRSLSDR